MNAVLREHRERVGRQIRRARITSGLSHDKLGSLVGTSRQHLIKLEKGQHLPSDQMLDRIAEATGKTVEFFTDGDDDEESDAMAELLHAIRRVVRDEIRTLA